MKNSLNTRRRTAMLSGATGFIGQHVSAYLIKQGFLVKGFARKKIDGTDWISGDASNARFVNNLFHENRPHIYIHLSGASTVEQGVQSIDSAKRSTIVGLENGLRACQEYNTKLVVLVSSSQVYQSSNKILRESSALSPCGPFERIKTQSDLLATSYATKYKLPLVVLRLVNVYGPGDTNYSRVVPSMILDAIQNHSITLWGDGTVNRQFLYIDDAVSALGCVLRRFHLFDKWPQVFNIGSNKSATLAEVAHLVAHRTKLKTPATFTGEMRRLVPRSVTVSSYRAKRMLGWEPRISLENGLRKTIQWYQLSRSDVLGD